MKSLLDTLSLVPPVPTPLQKNGKIDTAAVARIATHLQRGGMDAAFVLGSTGELASLSPHRRVDMIHAACDAFTIPVLVGIGDSCIDQTLSLAHTAAAAGAAAVVLHAPSYYEIGTEEMCDYLNLVLPQLPLPVYLYNMPWLTGFRFDRETVRCGISHPGVKGIKDSSGQADTLKMLIEETAHRPEIRIFAGNEFLFLDALQAGAHGVVGGGSNLYPELFRELLSAFQTGDIAKATDRQRQINQLGESLFNLNGNPCSVFSTIKAGLASLGLCEPDMAPPLRSCSPEIRQRIRSILRPSAAA